MSSLKESVLNCSINANDDDIFIAEFNKLAEKKGNNSYHAVIQMLTDLDLESGEAKKCWVEIIIHRENISRTLDKKISLITAISDYFSSYKKKSLKRHKIVGINTYEKAIKESTHDNLTGLFNKIYFQDTLNQHLSLSERNNTELSILFLDIDDFKEINDTFGHHSGDVILKSIAHTIKQELRTSDIAARFGGDEFVILMPNTHKTNAFLLSERLRKTIMSKSMPVQDKNIQITISGGVAGYPVDAIKAES